MNKFVCIHGHFYQPPRENPWLDEVEMEDSAYPYDDWNKRISAECYARNAASRILDPNKKIVAIINNYSKISFNFGPTLLSWMERNDSETYQAILEADKISCQNFGGHGSAIAQVYNHSILPLANSRDKRTQITWGIRDFERRFERKPEGMWLSETAVDLESLDLMAEQGIAFTVLAPHQARRIRKLDDKKWQDVNQNTIDSRRPYLCRLPSGRSIAVFFYNGAIARAVAFEGLLGSGEHLAKRLLASFDPNAQGPQLAHIATDGETYGHHHKFGDMALAYCLHFIESNKLANLTVYGEYLEKHPPAHEVEIEENTSWSCAHGVERWRSDCGCNTGIQPGWDQKWRAPLRESLDWLRDELISVYEQELKAYVDDVWACREDYIHVILDRSPGHIDSFLRRHVKREISEADKVRILQLLEIQHNSLLMATSCAWFFNEISGIEPVQVLKYAARAIQLVKELNGMEMEEDFLKRLEEAKSNVPEYQNGAVIYRKFVRPSIVDLLRVGAHYAVTALFEEYSEKTRIYCYRIVSEVYERKEAGRFQLAIGRLQVRSELTWEQARVCFAVLHMGEHNLVWGVHHFKDEEAFESMSGEIQKFFPEGNVPQLMRLMDRHFGAHNYSLWHLFRREQQIVLEQVLKSAMEEIEASFRQIYERYYPLLQVRKEAQVHLPKVLATIVEFILNRDLCEILAGDVIPIKKLDELVTELKRWSFEKDKTILNFTATRKVNQLMGQFFSDPEDLRLLELIEAILRNLSSLNLDMDFWKAQNLYFALSRKVYRSKQAQAEKGDPSAKQWISLFDRIGHYLQVKVL